MLFYISHILSILAYMYIAGWLFIIRRKFVGRKNIYAEKGGFAEDFRIDDQYLRIKDDSSQSIYVEWEIIIIALV